MGLIIDGKRVPYAKRAVLDYVSNPRLALGPEDRRLRHTRWIRQIVLHTTKGEWPSRLLPGYGPDTNSGDAVARWWRADHGHAGAHLVVDWDGTITCHADLVRDAAFHAGPANETSIGIEIYQGGAPDHAVYEGQLLAVVELVDWMTGHFHIQRQMPPTSTAGIIHRCSFVGGLKRIVGVIGHRHITRDRGCGDPGDHVFDCLAEAGYEEMELEPRQDDRRTWLDRQRALGMTGVDCDGIPGPHTVDMLQAAGHRGGLWVQR